MNYTWRNLRNLDERIFLAFCMGLGFGALIMWVLALFMFKPGAII